MANQFQYKLIPFFLIVFLVSGCAGLSKKDGTQKRLWDYKKSHFNLYSIQDEVRIGERYIKKQKQVAEKKGWDVNPKKQERLRLRIQGIVNKLAKVSDKPDLPYEVVLFDRPQVVNAFCLPGGKIGVFTGLFDSKKGLVDPKSDDEIAAVMGHEIAHATMRHVTRKLTSLSGYGLLGGFISVGVGSAAGENWGYAVNRIFNTGASLYLPNYSRAHEREADQVGMYYMAKAGFDPQAAIDVWQKASDRKKAKGKSDKTSFFDSHPASGERAQFLRTFLGDAKGLHH